jgi:hypothetical protein
MSHRCYARQIERKLMEAADMMAATLDQPADARAWDHLLIYAPRDALERRLHRFDERSEFSCS